MKSQLDKQLNETAETNWEKENKDVIHHIFQAEIAGQVIYQDKHAEEVLIKCLYKAEEAVKQFIREEQEAIVKAELKSLLEEVEGMKKHDMTNVCDCGREVEFAGFAFNEALEDIKALITKRLE